MLRSRKVRFVAGGVGVLMLVGAGTGVAVGGGSHRARWMTVDEAWVLDTVEEAEVAVLPDGTPLTEETIPPPGSMFFFRDEIYAAAGEGTERGARIGTGYGNCTVGTAGALCEVHASVDGRGSIEFAFAFAFSDFEAPPDASFAVAVTGGTGEFAGISGELLIDETDPDASRAELDAVIPRR